MDHAQAEGRGACFLTQFELKINAKKDFKSIAFDLN
jgi:hypothetical protein